MCGTEALSRDELIAAICLLEARIESLEAENARLRALLAEREGRSGTAAAGVPPKPPAWVRANRPQRTKKPRRKRQENHARPLEAPTEEVTHAVDVCPDCGRKLEGGWVHRRRQVIDLPLASYVVRDHLIVRRYCGVCQESHVAQPDLSDEVVGKSRVSIRVMALVAYLKTECRLPTRAIQDLLKSVYGLWLSIGELTDLLHRVADLGREQYRALLEELRASPVVHADETGWREDGINGYLWAFLTQTIQFFKRDKSRSSAIPLATLTPQFRGILVSDFYSGYSPLSCGKQRCWVHLLRDLKELEEMHPNHKGIARWRSKIGALYTKAVAYRERQLELTHPIPMRELQGRVKTRDRFERALHKLIEPYIGQQDDPRRVLAGRMEKFLYQLFVFLEYPDAPPENNFAERCLRPAVVARKISGGTRSERGSETMAILRTLFGTWSLRHQAPLHACLKILSPSTP